MADPNSSYNRNISPVIKAQMRALLQQFRMCAPAIRSVEKQRRDDEKHELLAAEKKRAFKQAQAPRQRFF